MPERQKEKREERRNLSLDFMTLGVQCMYVSTPFLFPATCTFPNVLSRGREMAFEFTFLADRHAYYIRTVSADLSLHAALQMSQIAPPPTLVAPPPLPHFESWPRFLFLRDRENAF